jgi:hypothetical protein
MNSANPNDLLSAYYDGEAAPHEEAAAEALVEGSPEASREIKDYKRLSRALQSLPKVAAPPEFAAAVMQRAERESLIPLDPALSARATDSPVGPRRRWIVAGVSIVSVAAALILAINVFAPAKRQAPRQEIARQEPASALADLQNRKTIASADSPALKKQASIERAKLDASGQSFGPSVAKSDDASRRDAVLSAKAGAPLSARATHQPAAAPMSAVRAPSVVSKEAAEQADQAGEKQRDLGLMLPANLKTAKMGDVVEALQQDGQQVAVVRLTVVNQIEGLNGVQSLLVRNTSRTLQNVDEIRRVRQQFSDNKSAEVSKSAVPSAAGDMICVYVEGSRDEMFAVLQGLQNESHIQAAELTNTISYTALNEYANQTAEGRSAVANRQIAKGAVAQSPPPAGSQLAVRLPAATVNKILSARQSTHQSTSGPNSNAPAQVVQELNVQQRDVELNASGLKRDDQQREKGLGSADQGQASVAAQQSVTGRLQSKAAQGRSRSRNSQDVAAAQKPFQIFFVITDQPQSQTPVPASNAAPSAARPNSQGPVTPAKPADSGATNRAR